MPKIIRKGLNPLSTNAPFQGFNPLWSPKRFPARRRLSAFGRRSAFPARRRTFCLSTFLLFRLSAPAPWVPLLSSLSMETPGRHDSVCRNDLFPPNNDFLVNLNVDSLATHFRLFSLLRLFDPFGFLTMKLLTSSF